MINVNTVRPSVPPFEHTNTQTHKHTNTQTHKHTNTQTHKHTNTQTYKVSVNCFDLLEDLATVN